MAGVYYQGALYSLNPGETLLDGLVRQGVPLAYGCRAGVCLSCVLQADAAQLPVAATQALPAAAQALGHFLPCCCVPPEGTLWQVQPIQQAAPKLQARVLSIQPLHEQAVCIRLEAPLVYAAGQYIQVFNASGVGRCYSLASTPTREPFLELHIKHWPQGQVSEGLCRNLAVGDRLSIQGPMGQCFYTPAVEQPLLLAAMGTGLAPLYGLLRSALDQGHSAPIYLYAGAKQAEHCYLKAELTALCAKHPQLSVVFMAQQGEAEGVVITDFYRALQARHPCLTGFKVYVCGAESFVRKLKKACFLAGAAMQDIVTDTFLPASP